MRARRHHPVRLIADRPAVGVHSQIDEAGKQKLCSHAVSSRHQQRVASNHNFMRYE